MTDIRALMAQERQARRINHEFASYTKSGALMCTVCQLNVRSDTLWDGHLRSANHKANVKKLHQAPRAVVKRKIEDVEETQEDDDVDIRKKLKPKPRGLSEIVDGSLSNTNNSKVEQHQAQEEGQPVEPTAAVEKRSIRPIRPLEPTTAVEEIEASKAVQPSAPPIDEDEWAAFERDIAPLAQPDYSAATITAAPVSAAQLEAEAEADRRKLRTAEAEEEKEEEARRMEEEFEVMEEMEERLRILKERREALRSSVTADVDTRQQHDELLTKGTSTVQIGMDGPDNDSDDDDDDGDDWYS